MPLEEKNNSLNLNPTSEGRGGIFLIGFMGSGKSYWAKQLGQRLQLPHFDLDHEIEESEGRSIAAIFAAEGEESFRKKEQEALVFLTETHDRFVMATGGGTPCFYNNIDYMNRRGTTVWLNPSVEVLEQRLLKQSSTRPLLAGLDEAQLKTFITRKLGDRKIFYQQAKQVLFDEDLTMDRFLESVFQKENKHQ